MLPLILKKLLARPLPSVRRGRGKSSLPPGLRPFIEALETRNVLSFTGASFAVGNLPQAVLGADFNRDGVADVAVVNVSDNNVSVLLGQAGGGYQAAVNYAVGTLPTALGAGDFDHDGILDLVATNSSANSISFLRGVGNGTFQAQVTFTTGGPGLGLAVGDLNGDGDTDVVTANGPTGNVSVLLGNGDGTFQGAANFSVSGLPTAVALGDVDRDGDLDAVTANQNGNNVSFLPGDGTGSLGAAVNTSVGNAPVALALADLDRNGTLDVAAANAGSDTVTLLPGVGNGTFSVPLTLPTGLGPQGIAVGDFNGDRRPDLAVPVAGPGGVNVFFNTSGVSYEAPPLFVPTGGGASGLAVAQLNADARADLVVANAGGNTVTRLLNNYAVGVTGMLAPAGAIPVGNTPLDVITGDFNRDGRRDLAAVRNGNNDVAVRLGNGNGTFQAPTLVAVGSFPTSVAVGDFNKDGKEDLVVGEDFSTYTILLGNGSGAFTPGNTGSLDDPPKSVSVGDFNRDGNLDLAFPLASGSSVDVALGNGDGTFQIAQLFNVGTDHSDLALGDFNRDGKVDVVTSNPDANNVSFLAGNGDGTLGTAANFGAGQLPTGVAAADFDLDGDLDLAVSNGVGNNVSVLLGNGNGTFQAQVTYNVGGAPDHVYAADVNGDGFPDLLAPNVADDTVSYLRNLGNGTFAAAVNFTTGDAPARLVADDLNRDGALDLVAVNVFSEDLSVFLGQRVVATQLQVTAPPTAIAGSVVPVTVSAVDVMGRIDPLFNQTLSVTITDPQTLGFQGVFFQLANGGTITLPVNLRTAGPQTISFRDLMGTFTGSVTVNVTPGPTATFGLRAPVGKIAGAPFPVEVAALDAFGNLTPTYTGTVRFTSTDGAALLPPDYTFVAGDNGVRGFMVTLNTPGSGTQMLTATDTSMSLLTRSTPVAVNPTGFAPPAIYPTGLNPNSVAAGDLNGDGIPDLAIANNGAGNVSVQLGNPDGTFRTPVAFPTAAEPITVRLADLDRNGTLDLVVACANSGSPGAVSVLLNLGGGAFLPLPNVSLPNKTESVAVGDLNNDGIPDLVAVNKDSNNLSVLLGIGNGTFQTPANIGTPALPVEVVLGDFNRDGKLDVATLNQGAANVSVLLGNGNGTLQAPLNYAIGSTPLGLAAADVNRDGKLDLVVATNAAAAGVGVFLGNGDGTFQGQVTYAAGVSSHLAVADLTNDGVPDVALAQGTSGVGVMVGNGDGTFQNVVTFSPTTQARYVVAADFNRDGRLDLATAVTATSHVRVLLNTGNVRGTGVLTPPSNLGVGATPEAVARGDFNGDGIDDLAVAAETANAVSVLLGLGNGAFQAPSNVGTSAPAVAVAAADFNGDGRTDLVTVNGNGSYSLLLGNGNGTFQPAVVTGVGGVARGLAVADYNKDGKPDLILSAGGGSSLNTVLVFLNTGGSFAPANSFGFGTNLTGVAVADLDGDGNLEILAVDEDSDNGALAVFRPGRSPLVTLLPPNTRALAAGDLNGDGKLDVAVARNSAAGRVEVLFGLGNGTFAPAVSYAVGTSPKGLVIADLDRDGLPDLVVSNDGSNSLNILRNLGGGFFLVVPPPLPVGAGPRGLVAGDFNRDGVPDLAVTQRGANTLGVLLGIPKVATHFQVVAPPVTTAGVGLGVTLRALDASNDIDVNYAGVARFRLTDPQAAPPVDAPFMRSEFGVKTVPVTLKTFGPQTVKVTDPMAPGLTGQSVVQVNAAATAKLRLTAPVGKAAGVSFPVTVTAVDAFGNVTPGYTGTIRFTSSDGAAQLPGDYTFVAGDNGVRTFTVTLNTPGSGSQTLTATDTGTGTINGVVGVAVNPTGFAPAAHFGAGTAPRAVALADLNRDGRLDLVTANAGSDDIRVAYGDGTGKFGPGLAFATGVAPRAVAVADFNGDGLPDVAVSHLSTNAVAVFLNNGFGLLPPASFPTGTRGESVAAADLNGDGKADLVVANGADNTVSVLLGFGNGVFMSAATFNTGADPHALQIADVNRDGRPDLVTANASSNNLSVLLGNGNGTFQPRTDYPVGSSTEDLVLADFDRDGDLDYATANGNDNTVSVGLGDGNGAFGAPADYSVGMLPFSLVALDVNGDGRLDLAAANGNGTTVGVLLGLAGGVFAPAVNFDAGAQPRGVAAGDVNGDGRIDLVTANQAGNDASVLLNTANLSGTAVLQTAAPVGVGTGPRFTVTGDFNRDGRLDLAVANQTSNDVSIRYGDGLGGFTGSLTLPVGTGPVHMVSADFNNDGRLDLAVANSGNGTVTALLGNSNNFAFPIQYGVSGTNPQGLAAGDFNGDGRLDLLVANQGSNNVSLLLGNGSGFAAAVNVAAVAGPTAVAAGDLNGDGLLDVVVVSNTGNTAVVLLNGPGGLMPAGMMPTGASPRSAALADFNRDGRLDLVVANESDNGIGLYLGNGAGGFGPAVTFAAGTGPYNALPGEFDGDGLLDLLIPRTGSSSVSVMRGLGNGTFQGPFVTAVGNSPRGAAVGDFNGDGVLDAAVNNFNSNNVTVLLGRPNFADHFLVSAPQGSTAGAGFTATVRALDPNNDIAVRYQGVARVRLADGRVAPPANAMYLSTDFGVKNIPVTFHTAGPQPVSVADAFDPAFGRGGAVVLVAPATTAGLRVTAPAGKLNGAPFTVKVEAVDAFGNVTPGYTGTVRFTSSDSFANLPADYTFVAGDNGVRTFTVTLVDPVPGSQSVTVTDTVIGAINGAATVAVNTPLFAPVVYYPVGDGPQAVVLADLNRDGRLDAVTPDADSNTLGVSLGRGDGTFAPVLVLPVGTAPQAVAVADFNGDGVPDVSVGTRPSQGLGNVSVLFGRGNGDFDPPQVVFTANNIAAVTAADLDGNGTADLAVANGATNITILLGSGFGSFGPPGNLVAATTPTALQVGDLNRDGKADLVAGSVSASLGVFLGNGDGTFQARADYGAAPVVRAITLADLDRDGDLDVVTANDAAGSASVFLNNGTGVFLGRADFGFGSPVPAVTVADVNQDGIPDLAVGVTTSNAVIVLLGVGNGTYRGPINYPLSTVPLGIAAGDVNGDGRPDLVFATTSNDLGVILNTAGRRAAGTLQAPVSYATAANAQYLVSRDLNGDGKLDLAVTSVDGQGNGNVSILLGNGDGTFQGAVNYAVAANPSFLTAGDFNGDGKLDLATTGTGDDAVSILLGNGNGTFQNAASYATISQPVGITVGDLTGDGVPDLVVTSFATNQVDILLGMGNGTFASIGNTLTTGGSGPRGLTLSDLDRDGFLDIAVVNSASNTVSALLNRGDFTFAGLAFPVGANPDSVTVADFNRDGRPDLVVNNRIGNTLSVLLGIGNGTFQPAVNYTVSALPQVVAVADYNGDGLLDLATGHFGTGTVSLLFGRGDGTFQNPVTTAAGSGAQGLVADDFNGDGTPDLAVARATTSSVSVLLGNPTATAGFRVIAAPTGVAGDLLNVTVVAVDANGDLALNYTGTVHFTSDDGQAVLPADYTFQPTDLGTHVFQVTLKTAGVRQVTATDTVSGSVTGMASVLVTPASAATFLVAGHSSPRLAGQADTITVTALDAFGNAALGYTGTVTFTSSDPQALLHGNYTFAASDMAVKSFAVTLKTSGLQAVTATDTVDGAISGAQSGIDIRPSSAAALQVTGFPSSTTAGVAQSFTVTAFDPFGNVATGYLGNVRLTSSDAQAVLPADYAFTISDGGIRAFSAELRTVGTQSLTATDTVFTGTTGTQTGLLVTPAAASQFAVTGFPPPVTAGVALPFTVTALDPFGNIDLNYVGTVTFTSSDPQATLPADYTFIGSDSGTRAFTATLRTAGPQAVTATDTAAGSVTGTLNGIPVMPAAASTLVVSGFPSPTTAGAPGNLTVTARDAFGNVAFGYTGTVTFTSDDPQAVLPANYTFDPRTDGGMHVFAVTFRTVGTRQVTVTDTVIGSISGIQSGITVTPAAAATLTVTGFPPMTTAGVSQSFTVTAFDAFGNIATGYTGTVRLTSSDQQAQLPADYTFTGSDNGTRAFSAALRTVGTQSLTATDTVTGTITGTQMGLLVTPATASSFAVTGFPSPTTAGVAQTFTVTALDPFGNVATDYLGTVRITSSDPQAQLPGDSTFTRGGNGTSNFSASLRTAGIQSLTVTDTVTASITGTLSGLVVTPAAAGSLVVGGFAPPVTAGAAQTFTVTALDPFGNTDVNYTGTVTFASDDPQATLPDAFTFGVTEAGTRSFSATFKSAGVRRITLQDNQQVPLTGLQAGIVVTPAATSVLTVTALTGARVAGVAGLVTVTAQDAFGNVTPAYAGTVRFTSSDAGATLPDDFTFTPDDLGTRGFAVTFTTAGTQTLTVTDATQTGVTGTLGGVNVVAAAASRLVVLGFPTPTVAGVSGQVSVTAQDAFGNTATGYTGTVTFTSDDRNAELPDDFTFTADDAGTRVFDVTLVTAGPRRVVVTDADQPALTAAQAGILVLPGTAASFTFTGLTDTVRSGSPISFTATAQDAFGNVATGYLGTVLLASTDPLAAALETYTFTTDDAGSHTFTFALQTAGTRTVSVRDAGNPLAAGTGNLFVLPVLTLAGPGQVLVGQPYVLRLVSSPGGPAVIRQWVISWGDGTSIMVPGNAPEAMHVFTDAPNGFFVSATAEGLDGTEFDVDNEVEVLSLVPQIGDATVRRIRPGEESRLDFQGVAADVRRPPNARGNLTLFVARYDDNPVDDIQARPTMTDLAVYDVRVTDAEDADQVTLTFRYFSDPQGTPRLDYFDTVTNQYVPVTEDLIVPGSFRFDPVAREFQITLSGTTRLSLRDLTGTVFTVSVTNASSSNTTNTSVNPATVAAGTASFVSTASFSSSSGLSLSLTPTQDGGLSTGRASTDSAGGGAVTAGGGVALPEAVDPGREQEEDPLRGNPADDEWLEALIELFAHDPEALWQLGGQRALQKWLEQFQPPAAAPPAPPPAAAPPLQLPAPQPSPFGRQEARHVPWEDLFPVVEPGSAAEARFDEAEEPEVELTERLAPWLALAAPLLGLLHRGPRNDRRRPSRARS